MHEFPPVMTFKVVSSVGVAGKKEGDAAQQNPAEKGVRGRPRSRFPAHQSDQVHDHLRNFPDLAVVRPLDHDAHEGFRAAGPEVDAAPALEAKRSLSALVNALRPLTSCASRRPT
jgi:hypothetical protein